VKRFEVSHSKAFTLVEVILSIGLSALILTTMGFIMSYALKAQKTLDHRRVTILQEQLLWTKLEDCLSRCCLPPCEEAKDQKAAIWLSKQGLEFHYRPLVSKQAELNLLRRAKLYVDDGHLMLETGPSPWLWEDAICNRWKSSEILKENVEEFKCYFLHVPPLARSNLIKELNYKQIHSGLNEDWQEDCPLLPNAIIIRLISEGHVYQYPIWIHSSECSHSLVDDSRL
jgi:hypothetical protein